MKIYKTLILISLVASVFAGVFMLFVKPKDSNNTMKIINKSKKQIKNSHNITNYDNYIVYNDDFAKGCRQDSDCIKVSADACGCTQGGKARAILKTKQSAYSTVLSAKQADVACAQVISNDPSCSATPMCNTTLHTCVLAISK